MAHGIRKKIVWGLLIVTFLAIAIWLLRPQPVLVDLGEVRVGTLEITVTEEARTRARNVYIVSAPVSGRVVRSPRVVGDPVAKNETTLAILRPTMPAFVDERSRSELRAALTAADATIQLTQHEVRRLEAEKQLADSEMRRAQALADRNVLAAEKLEMAVRAAEVTEHALAAAQAELEVQRNNRAAIEAQLADPNDFSRSGSGIRELRLTAPISGEVLRILQESEAVVAAGTPLIEVADTSELEIEANLLSTDAVKIELGAPARVVDWGGPALDARVTRVDPVGFEKVSALGIEELRVPVILDLVSPAKEWQQLKHNFRVTVEITVARSQDRLLVPSPALFRHGEEWAVFAAEQGRAVLRKINVGQRNEAFAEVLDGLAAAEPVILYPDERLADGTRIAERAPK